MVFSQGTLELLHGLEVASEGVGVDGGKVTNEFGGGAFGGD